MLLSGSLSGLLTVVLGAFGAHALAGHYADQQLIWWQKAVSYQGLHSLALLASGLLALRRHSRLLELSGWCFLSGILLFSGSLYLLALTDMRSLGIITPIGGLAFIAGWSTLSLSAWRLPG